MHSMFTMMSKTLIGATLVVAMTLGLAPVSSAASGWLVPMTVTKGTQSVPASFGEFTGAADCFDNKYDGGAINVGAVFAYFYHPEWGQKDTYYTYDVQSPGSERGWTLYAGAKSTNVTVSIAWDLTRLPAGHTATITDNDVTGQSYDMTTTPSISFVNTSTTPKKFTITVTGDAGLPGPSAPTGLGGTVRGPAAFLSWNADASATGYDVYRTTDPNGCSYDKLTATPLSRPAYRDSAVVDGTTYYYSVSGSDATGEGEQSGTITVVK